MDQDLMISIVGGWVVWGLTHLTRSLIPEGEFKTAVRHWTPEIAAVLSVAIVGAWQSMEGQEVWSVETLRRALSAAGAAVFGHSLVMEKLKMAKKRRGDGGGGTSGDVLKVGLAVWLVCLLGCGGGAVQGLEYLPDVEIKNADGCPDVSIRQPLPAPEGWSVMTETRIVKDCPPSPKSPPSEPPESP